jgi:hypothetical protein
VNVTLAWLAPFSARGACRTPSTKNVTVPTGVAVLGSLAVTVAVNVTVAPKVEGLSEELTLIDVGAWLTVWVCVPALAAKVRLPL